MSDRHRAPSTPYRSPGRRPAPAFLVPMALAILLLALPLGGIATAQTTVTIADGANDRVEDVTITNNSGQECQFTVHKSTVPPGGLPADLGEMLVQWDISSPDCSDVLVDLDFHYTSGEITAGNNVTESGLRAFRYVGAGVWADLCGTPCANLVTQTVGVNGVALLGDWTIGDLGYPYPTYPGPTALTIRGPARGESYDESGLVLALSVLTGIGLILGWRLRKQAV